MSHTHTHTHVPPPPPPPSAAQVQVQDGPPDLDALAPSVYRTRHPLPARPRTALLRVPWPGAREQPAQQVGRGRPGLTVTRSGGVGRRSTDVRSGGDGLEEESEEESEDEGSWEGEREEKWLDPRFGWSGRVRGHKEAMPYPLSYGEEELNYQIATVDIIRRVKGSVTYHVFPPDAQPGMCLDIGCGAGRWITAAAEEWPECQFVGVDAVPVQPKIARKSALHGRVRWVNCDFLEGKLPFEEETFDHVHCCFVSAGVPETKWFDLLEEITRVMKPGATFEFVDEDILFPGLTKPPPSPRSSLVAAPGPAASGSSTGLPSLTEHSTASSSQEGLARASASGSSGSLSLSLSLRQTTSNGTGREAGPYSLSREELLGLPGEHDHSLIEKLFNSVFQNRGINMEPTGGVQMFINMYLVDVQSCPPLVFPAQVWGGKSAPRMPSYDTESLATMPNNSGLHSLSRQGYLPNESFNAQHMINAQHTVGPQQLAHVLAVREAMWEEYCRLRSNEHAVVEQRAQERLEIRQRQAEREAEAREGRLPPSIDLVGNEGTSEKHHQLIEHHQRVVEQETSRDAARLAELDRLERASQEERIKSRSRLRGNMPDEIVVDRVQLASGGIAEWTDVTVVLGPNDRSRDREVFDILVDRYERDMRYRTQHTDTTARYLHCAEPPRTHLTGDELAREDEWRRGFQEYMDRGNDEELVWRRMRMYTARKSRRRLGTERAGRI